MSTTLDKRVFLEAQELYQRRIIIAVFGAAVMFLFCLWTIILALPAFLPPPGAPVNVGRTVLALIAIFAAALTPSIILFNFARRRAQREPSLRCPHCDALLAESAASYHVFKTGECPRCGARTLEAEDLVVVNPRTEAVKRLVLPLVLVGFAIFFGALALGQPLPFTIFFRTLAVVNTIAACWLLVRHMRGPAPTQVDR